MTIKRKTVVYKLIREDNQIYIGISVNFNARLNAHRKSKRFSELKIKEYEILYECDTYEEAELLEEKMIKKYDSFYNGLNESVNGKGNHLSPNFNTLGHKFSEESKEKMRKNNWSKRGYKNGMSGKNHSQETIEKIKKSQTGIYRKERKISIEYINEIMNCYKNNKIDFKNEKHILKKLVKKTHQHLIDDPNTDMYSLICSNGKKLTPKILYSHYFAEKFNVTPSAIRKIIKNDGKHAKDISKNA